MKAEMMSGGMLRVLYADLLSEGLQSKVLLSTKKDKRQQNKCGSSEYESTEREKGWTISKAILRNLSTLNQFQ